MERESFEDEEVAAVLNEHFVAIKVDREERPDIDHIYMSVCQALTGEGGWPLTILLTASQEPFFAGTYFPKHSRYGRTGLLDLLQKVAGQWDEKRDQVLASGSQIAAQMKPYLEQSTSGEVSEGLAHDAANRLLDTFDTEYGGFGNSPKFPTPHELMFLLRYATRFERPDLREIVVRTLTGMMHGGIYDHVGFGFSRYSTDRQWLVPHFEKMLYDNALLTIALVEAYQVTHDDTFAKRAREVLTYVLRDMTSDDGGFYCAEDADSEGVEGKFYVWTPTEVKDVLGAEAGERVCRWFGIDEKGNFEGHSIPNTIGKNLFVFAAAEGLSEAEWCEELERSRQKLFDVREKRVHPHKDDKVLCAWNGLMIAALSIAGRVLGSSEYTDAASRAVSFVRTSLVDREGHLLARVRNGQSAHSGTLDDYAFLILGLTELYETTFDLDYLRFAVRLQSDMRRRFWDEAAGGFYLVANDAEQLLARPKEVYDGALPSGNSVAAYNLIRLSRLTGDIMWAEMAGRVLTAFAGDVAHYPAGYTFYLMALLLATGPGQELVLAGWSDDEATKHALATVAKRFLPEAVVLFHDEMIPSRVWEEISPFSKDQAVVGGQVTLYVCENYACQAPTHDIVSALERLIGNTDL
ncbi:thioredoxin domain-containing protein [Alicyclobacillus sp. ALC3]|nr:thioredoxin domain-containing protein [Alicyclobacillus sp. ALC3]